MTSTRLPATLLFILLSLLVFSQNPNSFIDFEKTVEGDIVAGKIPSVSVSVAKNGKIIFEKAFGFADVENKIAATVHTPFLLASVSKPLTATGIMILSEKGMLNIFDPAERVMSPLRFNSLIGLSSNVRIVDLLNHTSGLGTYFQISYADEVCDHDSFEEAFQKYGTLFHPVQRISEYSNLGYGLLDYIIAKKSGASFPDFMKKELFAKLGMKNTFVYNNNLLQSPAKSYDADLNVLPVITTNTAGAGNIYSSAHDLALFGMFHLDKSNGLINRNNLRLMQDYQEPGTLYHYYDSTYYGLGWYSKEEDGYKVVWHEGGMMGASAMIKLIPEENIVITVLMNTFNQHVCQSYVNLLSKCMLPEYDPAILDEVADYKNYTSDSTFFGNWVGSITVDSLEIACTLKIKADGEIVIEYLDYTFKSFLTNNNPIPHKTLLVYGLVNKNSFIGMFPGTLPSKDIRKDLSHFMSLKLYKEGNLLSGSVVAIAAAAREYYAYPFYIKLLRE